MNWMSFAYHWVSEYSEYFGYLPSWVEDYFAVLFPRSGVLILPSPFECQIVL